MGENSKIKVLVIGHSGQLAGALSALDGEDSDVSIHCVGRPEVDLTIPGSVSKVFKQFSPDVVVNAAAYTAVDKAESDEELARAINAVGVKHLADACQLGGVYLIHVSTDYVFDGSGDSPKLPDDAVCPLGVYGATKLEGERLALNVLPSAVVIRTSWVYADVGNNFVATMLRLAESRDELGVVADQYGRPTYAGDLAQAILEIIPQLDGSQGGVYHYSNSGAATSWHGFAEAIFEQAMHYGYKVPSFVKPIATKEYPTPAKRPAWSVLDLTKIQATFGIQIPAWQDSLSSYFSTKQPS